MKATLEFDLDDPHERSMHRMCVNAPNAYLFIHDLENFIRQLSKYEDKEEVTIDLLNEKIREFKEDRRIDMDDLE